MLEFRSGGRRVSKDQFLKNLVQEGIDHALKAIEEKARGAAASVVDPETGKHADVFVRRKGNEGLIITTSGSAAFARELERRLGVDPGTVRSMSGIPSPQVPIVYLAHASEDHESLAKSLAERMMAEGIEVWLDDWEISSGDSLRRKMEEGLGNCTHFVALLTPHSLGKSWVETEIDAGFIRMVDGQSRFIGIRAGVQIDQLSPFLRTLRCPAVDLTNESEVASLIADIHGISRKPPRGPAPRYVKTIPEALKTWSSAAIVVAEHLVRNSKTGCAMDPVVDVARVAEATGLPAEDVRLGVLDLKDSALIEETKSIGEDDFWPKAGLFVEFDRHFMDFDNRKDAVALANWLVSTGKRQIDTKEIAEQFADWEPRRLNSALTYLDDANVIESRKAFGQAPWCMISLAVTDRTRRFVRDHS